MKRHPKKQVEADPQDIEEIEEILDKYDPESLLESVLERFYEWGYQWSQTPAFAALTDEQRDESEFIVESFTDFMCRYVALNPKDWTTGALEECLVEVLPAKITAGPEYFRSVGPVLSSFFSYLDQKGLQPNAHALARRAKAVSQDIVDASEDRSRWGMAKTIGMAAMEEGIDLENPRAMKKFIARYNADIRSGARAKPPLPPALRGLFGSHDCAAAGNALPVPEVAPAAAEPAVHPSVGPNEPCPCGSGKKYKKCCGQH